jgi:hypothetical protein
MRERLRRRRAEKIAITIKVALVIIGLGGPMLVIFWLLGRAGDIR